MTIQVDEKGGLIRLRINAGEEGNQIVVEAWLTESEAVDMATTLISALSDSLDDEKLAALKKYVAEEL